MEDENVDQEQETHPLIHKDDHHHRSHHPHSAVIQGILASFLIFTLILFGILGYVTNAPFGNVLFSFAPSILLAIIGFALLSSDLFDMKFLTLAFVASVVIAGAIIAFTIPSIDLTAALGLNVVLGSLLIFILSQAYDHPTEQEEFVEQLEDQEPEEELDLEQIITHIAENSKALNVVIGRVYNLHYGTTKTMREKIKINPEWYSQLVEETDPQLLIGIIRNIQARAEHLVNPENQVFTQDEVSRLRNLTRDPDGLSTVAEVLQQNTDRPVEQFRKATVHYSELALGRLRE